MERGYETLGRYFFCVLCIWMSSCIQNKDTFREDNTWSIEDVRAPGFSNEFLLKNKQIAGDNKKIGTFAAEKLKKIDDEHIGKIFDNSSHVVGFYQQSFFYFVV